MPDFEVILISIDWKSPDKARAIIPSKKRLKASIVKANTYEYDIVLYTKENELYTQFAIKTNYTPFLKNNDEHPNQNSKLYNIQDDLWIIKGDWRIGKRGVGYHHCPSINTIGKIEIIISEIPQQHEQFVTIDINSHIEDFDFDALKDDFEGELWNLLTSNSSKAIIQKSEVKFGDEIFRFAESQAIIAFIHEFEKIAKNPKRELKHAVGNLPFDKVKPIPSTIQKLAVAGSDALLPSKTFVDCYDNYENRYLCFMLYKIFKIVETNSKASARHISILNSEIETIKGKIAELQKPQIVNQEQVLAEIQAQEQRVILNERKWQSISISLNHDNTATYHFKKVKLRHKHHQLANTYWCSTTNCAFCLISFPNSVSQYLKEDAEFTFELRIHENGTVSTNAGSTYSKFNVSDVRKIEGSDVEKERNILRKQKQNIEILKNNNWQLSAILNATDRNKLQNEKTNQILTLQKRVQKIETQVRSLSGFRRETEQFKPYLAKLINSNFFKKVNFKKLLRFQPSMTFIQNIQYRNALRYYQEILKAEGLDFDIFGLYEQITSYGVREMPQVFELWSLVSIIRTLENTFAYKHNPIDLQQLLNSISPQNKKIETHVQINFSGELNERKIVLHYQKHLANGKRPDVMLEISCMNRRVFIILDAKFKNYKYKKAVLRDLKETKDKYLIEDNYFVFTMHPCKDFINGEGKPVKMTNFGGHQIYFEKDKPILPFHKFGFIMIKPNETDNLKKVMGMALEYLVESNHSTPTIDTIIDPTPSFEMICLSCGSNNVEKRKTYRGTPPYACYYICSCKNEDCGHNIYIDYCWNCKTKLFKHGSYWDYHRTSVWSIFDIHCPNCGMTVADRPNQSQ